jgi:hypothetical protein
MTAARIILALVVVSTGLFTSANQHRSTWARMRSSLRW